MKIELNNPLVTNTLAIVAVISGLLWLWQRLNNQSALLAGLVWLVTMLIFGGVQFAKMRG